MCLNVWSHFKKKSHKRTKHLPPSRTVQQPEFLHPPLSLPPYLFNEEWTRVWKAARKPWASSNTCPLRASSCFSTPVFQNPWLLVFEWCSNRCSWDFHPAWRRSPVLDNRPATGEEHRMLSARVRIGALERDWGQGGGEQRRNRAGEDAVCTLSVFWVTPGDHGDVCSKLCGEQQLVTINVRPRSGRLRIRQLRLMWLMRSCRMLTS